MHVPESSWQSFTFCTFEHIRYVDQFYYSLFLVLFKLNWCRHRSYTVGVCVGVFWGTVLIKLTYIEISEDGIRVEYFAFEIKSSFYVDLLKAESLSK